MKLNMNRSRYYASGGKLKNAVHRRAASNCHSIFSKLVVTIPIELDVRNLLREQWAELDQPVIEIHGCESILNRPTSSLDLISTTTIVIASMIGVGVYNEWL